METKINKIKKSIDKTNIKQRIDTENKLLHLQNEYDSLNKDEYIEYYLDNGELLSDYYDNNKKISNTINDKGLSLIDIIAGKSIFSYYNVIIDYKNLDENKKLVAAFGRDAAYTHTQAKVFQDKKTYKDVYDTLTSMGELTPEQEERIRHQQAMVSRGQTGSLLGQGGYQGIGGPYISRAGQ